MSSCAETVSELAAGRVRTAATADLHVPQSERDGGVSDLEHWVPGYGLLN